MKTPEQWAAGLVAVHEFEADRYGIASWHLFVGDLFIDDYTTAADAKDVADRYRKMLAGCIDAALDEAARMIHDLQQESVAYRLGWQAAHKACLAAAENAHTVVCNREGQRRDGASHTVMVASREVRNAVRDVEVPG